MRHCVRTAAKCLQVRLAPQRRNKTELNVLDLMPNSQECMNESEFAVAVLQTFVQFLPQATTLTNMRFVRESGVIAVTNTQFCSKETLNTSFALHCTNGNQTVCNPFCLFVVASSSGFMGDVS